MQASKSSPGLIFDLPSDQYHGQKGSYSSSQLKTMLEDPELFYKKYITKEMAKEESSAFDTGTYFHCAILEPHRLNEECAVFTGVRRQGSAWDAFKLANAGKAILTNNDLEKAETLIKAVKESPIAMKYLLNSEVEVSAFIDVYVFYGQIYTAITKESFGPVVHVLSLNGWTVTNTELDILQEFAVKIRLKVRADSIRVGEGIISDLKSTTGNCKSEHAVKEKVASYEYDLSASLYLDVFSASTGDVYDTFAWIFASKDLGNCKTWLASEKQKQVGRIKWRKAVLLLARYLSTDWAFEDEVGICEPTFFNQALLSQQHNF